MTKQLREWTAPDGRVWRWNPEMGYAQRKVEDSWVCVLDTVQLLDHADALNALRADPYEPAPKGLREQIADVMRVNWLYPHDGIEQLLALIDRERPALWEVDEEVLVGELVRRGWNFHPAPTWKAVDMLTAPERAG